MDGPIALLVYVLVKYTVYAVWCGLGVRWLAHAGRPALRGGLQFGLVRVLIGAAAGFGIFLAGGMMHWNAWSNVFLQYLVVYAPVRWFEWGIMEALITRSNRNPIMVFALGADRTSRLWRLGGIVVSHLADIPMILMGGGVHDMLPIGRFLC